jgi:Putative metal-binding motif
MPTRYLFLALAACGPQALEAPDASLAVIDSGIRKDAGIPNCPTLNVIEPCCADRGFRTCENATGILTWSSCSVSPSPEQCDGLDNDCNGKVDDACTPAVQSCPAGTQRCDGTCQTLGGSCSVGVGACLRSGVNTCNITLTCSTVAGLPAEEICDGLDNNCNGTTDEGVTVACLPDADNDGAPDSLTVMQICPESSRGYCPRNFVSAESGRPLDCNPSDATQFQSALMRLDMDKDAACVGATFLACVGFIAPAGQRFANQCSPGDDCNDSNAGLFQRFEVRADADSDGFCSGPTFLQCSGYVVLPGYLAATQCQAVSDCSDGNAFATEVCTLRGAYVTLPFVKSCGVLIPGKESAARGTGLACPTGFYRLPSTVPANSKPKTTTCEVGLLDAQGTSQITQTCLPLVLGDSSCSAVADCQAF